MTDTEPVSKVVDVIVGALPIREFTGRIDALEGEHGAGLTIENGPHGGFILRTPGRRCGCMKCDAADKDALVRLTGDHLHALRSQMIVCDQCGNKRCPHATSHTEACTGSNDPGQPGSAYGLPDPAVTERLKGLDGSTPEGRARIWSVLGIEAAPEQDAS